ncbi:hypothetical protein QJS10_CPA06g01033 [Acorus calamus]|uniref:Reverse transcriptase domain-containing protein n=1 Tax=Acorus calamus TaxID=4465 RepID=A0AAV9ERN0_ACOCL|nr:hypothetical protein QJS10_CPA06g01033 [Acorus calamus]
MAPFRSQFHFETWWLQVEGFQEVVANSWNLPIGTVQGAKRVAAKLLRLKHTLKRWRRVTKAQRKVAKTEVANAIAILDALEECGLMEEREHEEWGSLKESMMGLLSMEEAEWRLRSRATWLKEGDNNTAFFHKIANQRRRKNRIGAVKVGQERFVEESQIRSIFLMHFKASFRASRGKKLQWVDEALKKLSPEWISKLEYPFSVEEIKRGVFGMEGDCAPRPDACARSQSSLSHMQYADDTMILSRNDGEAVAGIMFVVKVFDWLSGLAINWRKSAFYGINMEPSVLASLAETYSFMGGLSGTFLSLDHVAAHLKCGCPFTKMGAGFRLISDGLWVRGIEFDSGSSIGAVRPL